jgi:hypothetical protein
MCPLRLPPDKTTKRQLEAVVGNRELVRRFPQCVNQLPLSNDEIKEWFANVGTPENNTFEFALVPGGT